MPKHIREDLRVLRIIAKEPEHELVARPLQSTKPLLAKGWLTYGREYGTMVGNKHMQARTIVLTDAGREALARMEAEHAI